MTHAVQVVPDYPWTGTPLEELKMWRREMEVQLSRGQGNLMGLMFARNRVGTWRNMLAPGEWFACPACGGRGLWVDGDRTNRYCPRCSGTGILLTCEQEVPQPHGPARAGWQSWLRKRMRLDWHRSMVAKRHS